MMNNEQLLVDMMIDLFEAKSDAKRAEQNKAYMKHKFSFIGIITADRRFITKEIVKLFPFNDIKSVSNVVKILWQMDQREYHHAAIDILAHYHKLWQPDIIELIEYCLLNHSWWDSVDNLNIACVGRYFSMFPNALDITTRWNNTDDIWLQRSSIIFQKPYKKKTDSKLLAAHILKVAESKDFFVRKAIGWALREYAKTNKEWVIDFVASNSLHSLSRREAMKHLG